MAALVSGRDMIDAALRQTGTDSIDSANGFVDLDEALAILNGELAELVDVVIEQGVGDYYRKEAALPIVAGTSRYNLSSVAADFYEVIGIDVTWSTDIVRSAKIFTEAERNRFRRILPTWSQFCDVWYRPWADKIEFMPVPQSAISTTLIYIPTFTPLVDENATFDTVNQWHWMAIWGLVAYIREKDDDGEGAQRALGRKAGVRSRIESMAGRRIDGEPARVQRSRSFEDEELF